MRFSPKELELVGALLGDGNIYTNHGKYLVAFTGGAKSEVEYFQYLCSLIGDVWSKKPKPKIRSRGVRIAIYSKTLVSRLKSVFMVPVGKNKCVSISIPPFILKDWELCRPLIRGLYDTDGTVFSSNKPGCPHYPSIEFTTTSKKLALQLFMVLRKQGFRTTNIWGYCSKLSKKQAYKIGLNGRANLLKWVNEVGFSNPRKKARAEGLCLAQSVPGRLSNNL